MGRVWAFSENALQEHIKSGKIKFKKSYNEGERSFIYKRYKSELKTIKKTFDTLIFADNKYLNQVATKELKDLELVEYFTYPKGINFIKEVILYGSDKNAIILDFFAGSGTTAHAVMQLNAEDGGKRKFIMVQIPQKCDEKSEAFKAGFKTIADICKERIKRAGKQILQDNQLNITNLDVGFRTLKVDTSNMKDVYYYPDKIKQNDLLDQISSVKDNRTDEDLLFQVMLDWGLELSLPIIIKEHTNKKIFIVKKDEENKLVACFDEIDNSILDEVAKIKPFYFTFREDKIVKDSDICNFKQRLKQLSSDIEVKTI